MKLKYEVQDLKAQLEGLIASSQPDAVISNQKLVEEEIQAKIAILMEQKTEELEHTRAQN